MIYGKMWTVVRPTVGIPLFLGAVAASAKGRKRGPKLAQVLINF